MHNYGNSKALVAVQDTTKPMTGNLSSGYALSSDNMGERPGNPPVDLGENPWGVEGTVLSGEPLAIEYNKAVFEDKPEFTEITEEQQRSKQEALEQ